MKKQLLLTLAALSSLSTINADWRSIMGACAGYFRPQQKENPVDRIRRRLGKCLESEPFLTARDEKRPQLQAATNFYCTALAEREFAKLNNEYPFRADEYMTLFAFSHARAREVASETELDSREQSRYRARNNAERLQLSQDALDRFLKELEKAKTSYDSKK